MYKIHRTYLYFSRIWDGSGGIRTTRRAGQGRIAVRFPAGAREVCLVHGVQPSSAAYPTSVGTTGLSSEIKRTDLEVDQSLPSSAQFKNGGSDIVAGSYPSWRTEGFQKYATHLFVVCLATGPYFHLKWIVQRVRSSASSFKFQCHLFSLRPSGRFINCTPLQMSLRR
jgi:hypothetical protein